MRLEKSNGAIKGFFFDLDGTLVNTHEANYRAYKQAIYEVTNNKPDERLRAYIRTGESSGGFLPKLVPGISDDDMDAINSRKKEVYPDHLHVSELNVYLSTFLRQMSEHYVTALVTTAKKENAEAVLRAHDISSLFTFKVFGHDVRNMKPDPEAYLTALKRANLRADEVIAFEDSEKGLAAANAAGIRVVHIRNFL